MTPAAQARGFTLLELLMAAAITVLLSALMLSVTTAALRAWHRGQDAAVMALQAKLALDLLERDLQSGIRRGETGGGIRLAADIVDDPAELVSHGWLMAPRMKPATGESIRLAPSAADGVPRLADARFGLSGVWLRLIADTTETSAEAGVPHAIAYQIARRPISGSIAAGNPAAVRYTLFRTFLNGATTLAGGDDLSSAACAPLGNPSTSADPLATNVVDFGVWLYAREGNGTLRRIFPVNDSDRHHAATDASTGDDGTRYPDVADVMIRILSGDGVRRLDAMEKSNGAITRPRDFPNDAAWWWSVVEAHSRVFARRIEIWRDDS